MEDWINTILKPFVKNCCKPRNITPIAFLDQFRVHMNKDIMQIFVDLGCEVEKSPGAVLEKLSPSTVALGSP
jgi:hypothetical protein